MNVAARAQLTFQMLTLLKKCIYLGYIAAYQKINQNKKQWKQVILASLFFFLISYILSATASTQPSGNLCQYNDRNNWYSSHRLNSCSIAPKLKNIGTLNIFVLVGSIIYEGHSTKNWLSWDVSDFTNKNTKCWIMKCFDERLSKWFRFYFQACN